ncbi:MAG: septal ring lytic transglycosylase RlpA family protein [Sphingomonas sp.]|nr:septal ring lytic transglycosylase RlpA family protein [Sphingomonas sp.]
MGARFERGMAFAVAAMLLSPCAISHANAPGLAPAAAIATGEASYYADRFAGRRTASGEAYDPSDFTAAHRSLPFGTRVRVTDIGSGRSVVVRINDRGPWDKGRLIDISRAAANEIGLARRGRGTVSLALAEAEEAEAGQD